MDAISSQMRDVHEPSNADILDLFDKSGIHFIDLSFPPSSQSIGVDEVPGMSTDGVAWRRPRDFINGMHCLYEERITPSDLRPGPLSSHRFLSTVTALCEQPAVLKQIFDDTSDRSGGVSAAGAYRVRLFVSGELSWVTVDDLFPCFPDIGGSAGPVCTRTHGNQIWPLLLEKALAKVCGSYGAVHSLSTLDILQIITGAPCFDLAVNSMDMGLWDLLTSYFTEGNIGIAHTGSSTISTAQAVQAGLLIDMSYTVLSVRRTSMGDCLLNLRKPVHSGMEWTGDWSDVSDKWTQQLQTELGVDLDIDDGTFWISYSDFCACFYSVDVCALTKFVDLRRRVYFQSVPESPSAQCVHARVSSMMVLRVDCGPSHVYFTIHQDLTGPVSDIGVAVLRVNDDFSFQQVCATGLAIQKSLHTSAVLEAGVYLLVPISTGTALRVRQKMLKRNDSSSHAHLLNSGGTGFSSETEQVFDNIFRCLDADMDGVLAKDELESFLHVNEGGGSINTSVYQWMLNNFDSTAGGLSRRGFKQAQMYMYQTSGKDIEVVWNDLLLMGYNRQLEPIGFSPAVVVVHSSCDAAVRLQSFDESAYTEALESSVHHRIAQIDKLAEGKARLLIFKNGPGGVSLCVENCSDVPITVTVDCSGSSNTISHRGTLSASVQVSVGKSTLCHHLFPEFLSEPFLWKYDTSILCESD
eukprot:CAMPEP_0185040288 /NCGR_PEP_ID=MMETSP1103-20130426/38146_1 /TAXON_ID=36769 /ORGANISM="Paraphysomonas bandaiensis, Strain Caron Lab Isolate" /LENGTH=692 /DNA_ID=CAMNT_0027579523 /DNA_START=324 /DNA_END=2402 /DNA_ORIENTATION=+